MSRSVKVRRLPLCDFCFGEDLCAARYDGKTKQGPWANMCDGVGLGTGRGQKLLLTKEALS